MVDTLNVQTLKQQIHSALLRKLEVRTVGLLANTSLYVCNEARYGGITHLCQGDNRSYHEMLAALFADGSEVNNLQQTSSCDRLHVKSGSKLLPPVSLTYHESVPN